MGPDRNKVGGRGNKWPEGKEPVRDPEVIVFKNEDELGMRPVGEGDLPGIPLKDPHDGGGWDGAR